MMVAGDYAPRFRLDLMAKDLGYAASAFDEAGVDACMNRAALESFGKASKLGFGCENVHAVAKLHRAERLRRCAVQNPDVEI